MISREDSTNDFYISQSHGSITMRSGSLLLRFGISGRVTFDVLGCDSGTNWLNPFGDVGMLWKIHLRELDGTAPVYSNNEADFVGMRISKDEKNEKAITFIWNLNATEKAITRVEIDIRIIKGKSLSYWSLRVMVPYKWNVKLVDFPCFSNIAVRKGLKVVVPTGWGNEYDFKPCFSYEGSYPSWQAGMQMIALYDDMTKDGLYFAAHDFKANLKQFCITAKENSAELSQRLIPAIPDSYFEVFESGYDAVLGVFKGNYYEAGQIYREFALAAPWADDKARRTPPAWLEDTDLWLRPDGAAGKNLDATKRALQFFSVNTALHWYRWHEIPYDTYYPEYLPALPGIAGAVKELQALGTHVALYINGRLWDPESPSWTSEQAYDFATRTENGECYTEIYGSKVPNNVMCPYTEFWQDKVAGIARALVDELGVQGVYIDQIGAARGVPCWNIRHGHTLGGGDFWRKGYEALLIKTRKSIPDNVILITEENAECWLNFFDAHLMVNTQVDGKVVPLFPSVYSGKTLLICALYYSADEPHNSLPFRWKNSIAFLWGAQPGWIKPSLIMKPVVRNEAEFLRDIAQTRRYAHQLLNSGRFLGEVNLNGDNPVMKGLMKGPFSGKYTFEQPAVSATAWLSSDHRVGVLMTNISDEPHEVAFSLPLERAGLSQSGFKAIKQYNNSGFVQTLPFPHNNVTLSIPPRSALVLAT